MKEYKKLAEQKKQEIMQVMNADIVSVDEDFSNALDVLACFLRTENMSIIKELESVYANSRKQISFAISMGVSEGLKLTIENAV